MTTITLPGDYRPSVKSLLKAPTKIQGRIISPDVSFLSDYLFRGPINTPSGVVEYQVAKLDDLYAGRGEIQEIEPMSEYPMLDIGEEEETYGSTNKYGTGYKVSYEAVDRNDINPMIKGNRKIQNHLVRFDARRSLAAIEKAVTDNNRLVNATGDWKGEGVAWGDLAKSLASSPSGYNYTTLIVNKADAFKMVTAPDIKDATKYTDTRATSAIYNSVFNNLNGLLGLEVIINDFVPANKAYLIEKNTAGFVALEKDFQLRVIDKPETDHWLVQGSKRAAPFVDEPAAVLVIDKLDGTGA